eukprot:TRINITY_DN30186_c0_g1_i1.p1 TRINITY_DN30186_c0_g1~~TRINITY_DN30186_c0_g1_i1.p1  ORF type:complete len:275 (-),score=34.64 TRINITY_DN30186_c0_g1_i1:392-1216(-)
MWTYVELFKSELDKARIDYDDFARGKWFNVFGLSSNRFLNDRRVYFCFRVVETVLITSIFAWSLEYEYRIGCLRTYFIFLTHWALTLEVAYFWFVTYSTLVASRIGANELLSSEMPRCVKCAWLLQDLCLPASFLVFVLYWVLVAPKSKKPVPDVSYFTHGVNFALMMLDVSLSRQPYYLLHGFYFALFGFAYLLFSLIYWEVGGLNCEGDPWIYKSLDWRHAASTSTLAVVILFVVTPVVNLMFWCRGACCSRVNRVEALELVKGVETLEPVE